MSSNMSDEGTSRSDEGTLSTTTKLAGAVAALVLLGLVLYWLFGQNTSNAPAGSQASPATSTASPTPASSPPAGWGPAIGSPQTPPPTTLPVFSSPDVATAFPLSKVVALQNRKTGLFLRVVNSAVAVAQGPASAHGITMEATGMSPTEPNAQWKVLRSVYYPYAFRLDSVGSPGVYLRAIKDTSSGEVVWDSGPGGYLSNLFAAPVTALGDQDNKYFVLISAHIVSDLSLPGLDTSTAYVLATTDSGALQATATSRAGDPYAQWMPVLVS